MTQADPVEQADFQHIRTPGGCDCPIHREGEPITAPLGLRFAGRVHIESIPKYVAGAIYDAHHSYMGDIPRTNLVHHGLCYQAQLVGAITWCHPLIRSLDGTVRPPARPPTRHPAIGDVRPRGLRGVDDRSTPR